MHHFLRTFTLATAAALASCGGGDEGQTNYTSNASPGGIWIGTDAVSGLAVVGLVDELGFFSIIRADGMQIVGQALTAQNDVIASTEETTAFGVTFPDGSTHGSGTLTGTVTTGSTLDADLQFTTDAGTGAHVLLDLKFDTTYYESSSLDEIAGTYHDQATGTIVTVDASGSIFAQDAASSCVINGTAAIIEDTYNIYGVKLTYSNCQGLQAVLNGITFTGFATLQDTAASPPPVFVAVTGRNGSAHYALTYTLQNVSPAP